MGPSETGFAVFCVENAAEKLGLPGNEVFNLLSESGILDTYILPSYDVLHTQSKEYIVDDIVDLMRKRGVIE